MIIGISGKAGSGKDTAAKMLEVLYANPNILYEDFSNRKYKNFADIQIVHFADSLKETAQVLFRIGEWETNTQEGKKTTIEWIGKTVRELLQGVGQGLRDAIDPNLWIKVLFRISEWETNTQEGKKTTIDWIGKTIRELLQGIGQGLRDAIDPNLWVKILFANTEDWSNYIIADVRYPNEVYAIKERNGILLRIDRKGAGAGNHSSETALDNYKEWDVHIENNGSIEDLFEAMRIFTKNYPID